MVKSNVSSVVIDLLSDEGPTLAMLNYTISIGNTLSFLYFNLYLYSAYA